jgi:hypothetical protein
MEFAKTRVQLRQQKGIPTPRNPFRVVTQVYQVEGLRALYKGCAALVVVRDCSIIPFTLQLPRAVDSHRILPVLLCSMSELLFRQNAAECQHVL